MPSRSRSTIGGMCGSWQMTAIGRLRTLVNGSFRSKAGIQGTVVGARLFSDGSFLHPAFGQVSTALG